MFTFPALDFLVMLIIGTIMIVRIYYVPRKPIVVDTGGYPHAIVEIGWKISRGGKEDFKRYVSYCACCGKTNPDPHELCIEEFIREHNSVLSNGLIVTNNLNNNETYIGVKLKLSIKKSSDRIATAEQLDALFGNKGTTSSATPF